MTQAKPIEGCHLFEVDQHIWDPAQTPQPCPICNSTKTLQAEIEIDQYITIHEMSRTDDVRQEIIDRLKADPETPEWIRNTIPSEIGNDEYIHFIGPLACIHQQTISEGSRISGVERTVYIDDRILSPARSTEVYNHSNGEFTWGYGGSGPAQLGLALLLEAGASNNEASSYHQKFKWEIISNLPSTRFSMQGQQVIEWLTQRRTEEKATRK